jgi:hypothetical protein
MRTSKDGSTRPSHPRHIFTPEYLAWLAERDEPLTAAEADFAGPWHLEPHPRGGWAVLREGESLDFGSTPTVIFTRKEAAQLAAAILPGTARRLRYRLGPDPDAQGFPILLDGEPAGHSRHFNEDLLAALNTVDALMAAPRDFAWLLDAMGGLALEHVDRIAVARLGELPQ